MDLTEVLKDLPEEKQNAILEIHKSAVEQERNVGISTSRKKGEEVKKYMTEVNRLKDTIREHLDLDFSGVDDPSQAIADKLKSYKTQTANSGEYTAKLSRLEKQLSDMVAREAQATEKLRNVKISETLNQAFGDSFHAKDLLIKNLISSGEVRLADDGEVIFINGDDEFDIKNGVERLRKNRPDLIKNISNPGSGGSNKGANRSDGKTISLAEFNKLPSIEKAQKMSQGWKVID